MVKLMKHIGQNKNSGAKYIVACMQLDDAPNYCLVIETDPLPPMYADSLNELVQSDVAQNAKELLGILSRNTFPDGFTMLEALHRKFYLKKVLTSDVYMKPTNNHQILLSELNNSLKNDTTFEVKSDKIDLDLTNTGMAKSNAIAEEVNKNKQVVQNIIKQAELMLDDTVKDLKRYAIKANALDPSIDVEKTVQVLMSKYVLSDSNIQQSVVKEETKEQNITQQKTKRKYTKRQKSK